MSLKQRGFTLLEVMIAVFVLAIGLLGMAHLQITSLKHNQTAEFRSQSAILAADMLDRMRANRNAAHNGKYALPIDAEPSTTDPTAEEDISKWRENISKYLPNGTGQIDCDEFSSDRAFVCDITIGWTEPQIDRDSECELGEDTSCFTLSGAI